MFCLRFGVKPFFPPGPVCCQLEAGWWWQLACLPFKQSIKWVFHAPSPLQKRGKWLLTSRQIAPRMYLTRSTKATDWSQFSPRTASPAGALGVIFYPASKKAPTPHHTTPQHDRAVDLAWREEKWKFASQQITSARDIKKTKWQRWTWTYPKKISVTRMFCSWRAEMSSSLFQQTSWDVKVVKMCFESWHRVCSVRRMCDA